MDCVIKKDTIYDALQIEGTNETEAVPESDVGETPLSAAEGRRSELIQRKLANIGQENVRSVLTFDEKLEQEVKRFRNVTPISLAENPLIWWRQHFEAFPLLSMFMKANSAFQASSLSSERLFYKDKLLFGLNRQTIEDDRAEGLIVLHDFINRRFAGKLYSLCEGCPTPPSSGASYVVTCSKHNS